MTTSVAAYSYIKPVSLDEENRRIYINYPLKAKTENGKDIILRNGFFEIMELSEKKIILKGDEITGNIIVIRNINIINNKGETNNSSNIINNGEFINREK